MDDPVDASSFYTSNNNESSLLVAPSLRILCLHDESSNAADLSLQLQSLGERLYQNHAIEFVYINSPLRIHDENEQQEPVSDVSNNNIDQRNGNHKRAWWELVDPGLSQQQQQQQQSQDVSGDINSAGETNRKQYLGLDASILLLRQVWTSMPFWGILAMGQAATVASMLPLLPVYPPPQVMIFVRGETLLEETEPLLLPNELEGGESSISCLHFLSASPTEASKRLVQQFGGDVYAGVSDTKLTTKTLNIIGKFLVSRKKELRSPSGQESANVLVLQNHLFLAEQEAAHAVARHIANDPPKALMAVISPPQVTTSHHGTGTPHGAFVGGWSGGRRRAPNEEGGGAPCPSEFLLKREKRSTHPNGPTREHPNQMDGH